MPQKYENRYMLIDGNALIHRGFHAIPTLTNKTGEHTNAVFGFVSILLRAIKDLKPTHIAATFDLAGPTFRHEKYADYKATRVKAAPELYAQIPRVKEVVTALGIPIFEKKGFEADDCLGTLSVEICKKHKEGCDVMIVTGDLDTLQLVNDCVKIYTLRKGLADTAIYDKAAIKERYGLTPEQMVSYKALRGDPSDNIKGVHGIGEKGASLLIQQFGDLDGLYNAIKNGKADAKIKPKFIALLTEQEQQARDSFDLSKIILDVDLDVKIPKYEFTQKELTHVTKLFQELEFQSLMSKLPKNFEADKSLKDEDVLEVLSEEKPTISREDNEKNSKYTLVDTKEKLEKLISKLGKVHELAIDSETTSIDAIQADLVGISLSWKEGEGYYITANLVKELKEIIENQKVKKIGHNIKYDLLSMQNAGVNMDGIYFDTMIASFLLNAGTRQHNLEALAFNELGYQMQPIEELIGKGAKQITMDQVEPEKVSWYASEDADITWRLKQIYEPQLKAEEVDKIFYDIEMPLTNVLARMERFGIKLDSGLLQRYAEESEKQLFSLEKDIHSMAGEEFNINSPKQMKEVLFEKMKLEPVGVKKTKTGISTAAGELEKMLGQHPIIEKIMEYRELSKLQSTYILALPEMVNPNTGRIHTSYNQTIASTGRLSSTDPNLQNIPVKSNRRGIEVRKAFVAEKGYKLLSLDYSQIELRIVAHVAQDENMMEVFNKNQDIHTRTAMEIFKVDSADKVTKDQRRDAKTINFGVLYGLSSFGLSYRMEELSNADAKQFINAYFSAYPKVQEFIERTKAEVRETGMVRNELGRMRKYPDAKSSQFFIRQAAERAAYNFPLQSLAADIIKVAMINIHKELTGKDDCRMLLQVHDELLFEVKADKVEHYKKIIKPLMEDAVKLSIPVTVEAKVGSNWGEMEKL